MPRPARQKSQTQIYHIMIRGINRDYIFSTDEEKERFLKILNDVKSTSYFDLYAYALMDNHIHLLAKEASEDIGKIMKRIGIKYATWYNKRYDRVGHLFQDRYKSEVIVDELQFLTTLRYITQNPIKAKVCKSLADYRWSSYHEYITRGDLIDTDFVLQMFSKRLDKQVDNFCKFIGTESSEKCLDFEERSINYSDLFLLQQVQEKFNITDINTCSKEQNAQIEYYLKHHYKITLRQIARITNRKLGQVFRTLSK